MTPGRCDRSPLPGIFGVINGEAFEDGIFKDRDRMTRINGSRSGQIHCIIRNNEGSLDAVVHEETDGFMTRE